MNGRTNISTSSESKSLKQLLLHNADYTINEKGGEFILSLTDLPYLSDHAFQGIIVLPGSAYIEMALIIYNQLFNKVPGIIKRIKFENIILLSEEKTKIKFNVNIESNEKLGIWFVEKDESSASISGNSLQTSMYVIGENKISDSRESSTLDFIQNAHINFKANEFYKKLSENGNQYGPKFQNIKEIWISGDEALGKLINISSEFGVLGEHSIHPSLLDSFTQLLSCLSDSKGRTFVLNSIDEIRIFNLDMPEEIWCKAKLSSTGSKDENSFNGNLRILDSSGKIYLELKSVEFKYLQQLDKDIQLKEENRDICIVSTFTADPLEDSLKFWSNQFKIPYRINFAPYNQVFQELLDSNSSFHKNRDGINIILLGLEDWARKENLLYPQVDNDKIEELFKDKVKYTLPNQAQIVHLNKYETDYVYKEIFEDKVYLKHGITINDGDTVIDIGANIGLFTLFINQHCKNASVYSYEPSPVVYELLKLNSTIYGQKVKTFNYGVSDKKKTARFTFYNSSSVFSSFNANEEEDKEAIQAVVRNMLNDVSSSDTGDLDDYVEELTSGRLESQTYDCPLISVSDIIKDNNIENIDLLKIDAEKSELEILKGIGDSNWNYIKQIVIEIHDKVGDIFNEVKSILTKRGFQFIVEEEKFLKESGLYNIYAKRNNDENNSEAKNSSAGGKKEKLKENLENFNQVIHSFMNNSQVPMIIGVCERSPEVLYSNELKAMFDEMENKLFSDIVDIPNIFFLKSHMVDQKYPVKDYFDPHGNELGHLPYTQEYYTSLGTLLFRNIVALKSNPHKVIALDCDNTLWRGVCGEDGPKGIQITEPYKFLQQFIIDQIQVGMLVCLCSKNNEEDVLEVFKQRNDMLLKTEHLVSWKTNWDYKSVNLKSLAEELNLGLDSFIFIDDNPVECAEVRSNCPEVLTLQLPQDEEAIPVFMQNIWAFDHIKVTEEDKKRTKMYRENVQRDKYRESTMSLKDFLDGLKLSIKISNHRPEQINRISQLTFRTNQFNFTTIRRTETEVSTLLNLNQNYSLITEVSDRFGDYGLVGVLFYSIEDISIMVDTFLISCRVLGRGVEHKILSELGKIAQENKLKYIKIKYLPSPKNRPALDFIESIGSNFKSEISEGLLFSFPVQHLVNLTYEPLSSNFDSNTETENKKNDNELSKKNQIKSSNLYDILQNIANNFNTVSAIHNKVEESKISESETVSPSFIQPGTDFEKQMSLIWQKVLGKTKIGLNDNFFEIGGTSLKAVQLIALIKKDFGINLSIVKLFECPTVGLLCKKLFEDKSNNVSSTSEDIADRSRRRREKQIVRKR